MEKINYYLKSLDIISSLEEQGKKPTLLLHACCAPCATYPLLFLIKYFQVTIYFNNSNIYPKEEHDKRLEELKKFINDFMNKEKAQVKLVVTNYDYDKFKKCLKPFASELEGGARCYVCFEKRLRDGFTYADKNNFDFFTTALTISSHKNAQVLNKIGANLEKNYKKTKYFYSDFKKKMGINVAREMRDSYGLYQQDYCGCEYSIYPKKHK
ncbi:MAG: epoxyqueuosine reductase QueH [Bacilli bacterium]